MAWTELAGVPFDAGGVGGPGPRAEAALPALREARHRARPLPVPRGEGWLDVVAPYTEAQVAPTKTGQAQEAAGAGVQPGLPAPAAAPAAALGVAVADVQEATLAAVRGRHPVVEALLALKAVDKQATTFGVDYLQHVHPATGRIHAGYAQLGSEAGRMSCRDPNVQQVPHEGAYRACFRAGAGRVLVRGDYQQIELAWSPSSPATGGCWAPWPAGDDLHRLTAASLYGVPPEAVTPAQRAFGKSMNFGSRLRPGGGRPRAPGGRAGDRPVRRPGPGLPRPLRPRLARSSPAWRRQQLRGRASRCCAPWGAGSAVLAPDARATFRLNTPVQGTAADGFKAALGELWATRGRCPSGAPVLLVHDELVVECDEAEAQEAVAWVQEAMVAGMTRYLHEAPVRVEATVSRSWGGPPLPLPTPAAPDAARPCRRRSSP